MSSICWNDFVNISKLKDNQLPCTYRGKVVDPTSYWPWFCFCMMDRDANRVSKCIEQTIRNIARIYEKENGYIYGFRSSLQINDEDCEVIYSVIINLDRLSKDLKKSDVQKAQKLSKETAKKISNRYRKLFFCLRFYALANDSYKAYINKKQQ